MSLATDWDVLLSLSREARELYLPKQVHRLSVPPPPLVFLRKYVMPNLPVVIENGVSHWPALKKWSNEYLRNIIGDKKVTVSITPNGYADAPVGNKFVLPDEQEMKFSDFLIKLGQNNIGDEIVYIQNQNSSFLEEFSELLPDAAKDIPWASKVFGKLPDAVNFWMGGEHSVTSMHKDHYENMYAVISGSKTFILHPPTDLPCIPYKHYTVSRYTKNDAGRYDIVEEINSEHCINCNVQVSTSICIETDERSLSGLKISEAITNIPDNLPEIYQEINGSYSDRDILFKEDEEENENTLSVSNNVSCKCSCHNPTTVPWIAVNPLSPDYDKYPLYRHAHQLKVTLHPGDLLYLPSLWFHHVEQTNDTIALNFWYDMEYDIKYNYYKFVENLMQSNINTSNSV